MHKLFLASLSVFLLFFSLTLSAQSMSDDQILKYIIKEHNAGTSQAQIVSNLIKQGVDINQIRRVRKKYEKEIQEKSLGAIADKAVNDAGQMMRKNNGNERISSKMDSYDLRNDNEDNGLVGKDEISLSEKTSENKEMLFNGNKVFGRDIFNNNSLTFEPAMNIATPQNYVIGP